MSATGDDQEPRLAMLEGIARSTKAAIERIERRLDSIDNRLIAFQSDFDNRLNALQSDPRSDFRWLLGSGIGAFGALFGMRTHSQRWL